MAASIPYVPLDGRPWRLTMGLRPLQDGNWLEVDQHRSAELRRKAGLLDQRHEAVMATLPGSEVAGAELLAAVLANLGDYHPGLIQARPDGRIDELTTTTTIDPAGMHPLEAAARLVQEDLCLMVRDGGGWFLTAGCVCFPSRWSLKEKIGRDLSGIHAPVPGYAESLAAPIEAFFGRLRVDHPVWRCNWTLLDTDELHLPDPAGRRERHAVRPEAMWFRVERQTLRRLAGSGAVVFSIRTYVTSLRQLVIAYPEAVEALRATLPTVAPDVVDYKGWAGLIEPLVRWLADFE